MCVDVGGCAKKGECAFVLGLVVLSACCLRKRRNTVRAFACSPLPTQHTQTHKSTHKHTAHTSPPPYHARHLHLDHLHELVDGLARRPDRADDLGARAELVGGIGRLQDRRQVEVGEPVRLGLHGGPQLLCCCCARRLRFVASPVAGGRGERVRFLVRICVLSSAARCGFGGRARYLWSLLLRRRAALCNITSAMQGGAPSLQSLGGAGRGGKCCAFRAGAHTACSAAAQQQRPVRDAEGDTLHPMLSYWRPLPPAPSLHEIQLSSAVIPDTLDAIPRASPRQGLAANTGAAAQTSCCRLLPNLLASSPSTQRCSVQHDAHLEESDSTRLSAVLCPSCDDAGNARLVYLLISDKSPSPLQQDDALLASSRAGKSVSQRQPRHAYQRRGDRAALPPPVPPPRVPRPRARISRCPRRAAEAGATRRTEQVFFRFYSPGLIYLLLKLNRPFKPSLSTAPCACPPPPRPPPRPRRRKRRPLRHHAPSTRARAPRAARRRAAAPPHRA